MFSPVRHRRYLPPPSPAYVAAVKPYTIQPTPNPNSLKFTATGQPFIESGMLACANAAEAATHPLSTALFEIDGVFNVLVLPPFATVTKRPEADWNDVLPRVEAVLAYHLED